MHPGRVISLSVPWRPRPSSFVRALTNRGRGRTESQSMDVVDSHPHIAKVRVAGSNPVFRSKHNRRSRTLSRVPVLFPATVGPTVCPVNTCALTSWNGFVAPN